MQSTADVVIIGAGVIGASTAYHLTQMGISHVAVVEMGQVGSGTTSKSASMLSLQFGDSELQARMAKYSYARYMHFEDELGASTDFKKSGWLSLATAEKAAGLLASARRLQSLDITTELLTPDEIKRRYPAINTSDIALGAFGPDDGPFDPHMIVWGYINRARQAGVKLYQGARATAIRIEAGQVKGVITTEGTIATNVVVNAGGPWAIEIGRWVGVEIPIINLARTILVSGPFPDLPSDGPFVSDKATEWYFRPEGPGILMGMGKTPTSNLDIQFDTGMIDAIIEAAVQRVPVLEKATLLTGWTGVRPMTSDELPILGPVAQVSGFILNCGWGGTGIIQAPLAGQLIAEYISRGRASTMDLDPFSSDRFT